LLGRVGDGNGGGRVGHGWDQVRVLDRAGQGRVVRAPGLKVSAPPQHDQGRGWLTRAVPGGGGCVQRGDERPPRRLVGALGEQLLELVHHQQQSPRWLIPLRRGAVPIPGWPGWPSQGGLACGECEPGRIGVQLAPHRRGVRPGQRRHPPPPAPQAAPGPGEPPHGPPPRPPPRPPPPPPGSAAAPPPAAATPPPPPKPPTPPAGRRPPAAATSGPAPRWWPLPGRRTTPR